MVKLPMWQKIVIYKLSDYIVLSHEWKELNLEEECTWGQAVTYAVRAVTDTDSCIRYDELYEYTVPEAFEIAYRKGILDHPDASRAQESILRKDFFELFDRMLYVPYSIGGPDGVFQNRYVDWLLQTAGYPAASYDERMAEFVNGSPAASARQLLEAQRQENAADRWIGYGALDAFPNRQFDLGNSMTRGEFASVMSHVMGYSYIGANPFADLPTSWYTDDFLRACFARMLMGDGEYARPEEYVTREEAVLMLARAFGIEAAAGELTACFADWDDISDWAKPTLFTFREQGWMQGDPNGNANPQDRVSFLELFFMIDRFVDVNFYQPATYGGKEMTQIVGNVMVTSPDVVLKNMTIHGNLYLAANIYQGRLVLDNVSVDGTIYLWGLYGEPFYLVDSAAKDVKWVRNDWSNYPEYRHADGSEYCIDAGTDPVLHDDLSVTWTKPANMLGIDGYGMTLVDEFGVETNYLRSLTNEDRLCTADILRTVREFLPKKLQAIRVYPISFCENVAFGTHLEIDLPSVVTEERGSSLCLGTLCEEGDKAYLTLAGEDTFQKGRYYCVTSVQITDGYATYYVFQADSDTQTQCIESLFGYLGDGSCENVTLQAITVEGDVDCGFHVAFTPEPKKPFTFKKE